MVGFRGAHKALRGLDRFQQPLYAFGVINKLLQKGRMKKVLLNI